MPDINLEDLRVSLEQKHDVILRDVDVLSAALYPKVFDAFCEFRKTYGDVSVLPTNLIFDPCRIGEEVTIEIQRGKRLYLKLLAVGQVQPNGSREVFWEVNGNARSTFILDANAGVDETLLREKATDEPGSVGAPMAGVVFEVRVEKGTVVKAGDPLAVMSAMKMETVVSAPVAGKVTNVAVKSGDSISAGDLILSLNVSDSS